MRKFARRNRRAVAGGTGAVVALVAGATFAAVGMVRATRAESRAADATAADETAAARRGTDLLVGRFRVNDPSAARGNAVAAREILDAGARRVEHDLATQPRLQGRLMQTIGSVYGALGLYDPRPANC